MNVEIKTLKTLVKQIEKRIKEVQQECVNSHTQEDVWIKQGVENELIHWKISLDKWVKKIKYEEKENK